MNQRWYFVSDLHMFAARSQVDRWENVIEQTVCEADVLVLGGDIFDFRWSTLPDIEQSVAAAIDWLSKIASINPACQIHYVLGNHDFNERFCKSLSELCERLPNMQWHDYYFRAGNCLFLHGDVADRVMTHEQFVTERERWRADESKPAISHRLYDVAMKLRLHKLATLLVNRRAQVIKRLEAYMADLDHGVHNELEHVYFGHTHARIDGWKSKGVTFHNGGAPMTGLAFEVLATRYRDRELPADE
jgi:UDP-2,3-diacylglucosamine hydrolase